MIQPFGQHPYLSTSLNQYCSWPVIHPVGSPGVFHISLRPQKYNWESGRKRINEHFGLRSAPSARKGKSMCDTLHSLCICRLSVACILCETSTKGTNNADIFSRWLTRPLCSSSGLSSRLFDLCWLCHSLGCQLKADRSRLPSVVNCFSPSSFVGWPLSSLASFSPRPLPFLQETSSPLFGFRAQNRRRSRLPGSHTQ